jgi:hypothetical protein
MKRQNLDYLVDNVMFLLMAAVVGLGLLMKYTAAILIDNIARHQNG